MTQIAEYEPSFPAPRPPFAPPTAPALAPPRRPGARRSGRWWRWNAVLGLVALCGLIAVTVTGTGSVLEPGTRAWWIAVMVSHLPFFVLLAFLLGGFVERIGYFWRGRRAVAPGRLPRKVPRVCVQLPMFNEGEVARRAIEAACAMRWPRDRFEVQILDDSTEPDVRDLVDVVCGEMRALGVDCVVLRRDRRDGYKAGALEAGRAMTDADLLVILDADFLPQPEFVERAVPHFFDADGEWLDDLAMVQAQWGHLNDDESALTRAQSLWVDDHHTVQMSWRAARWGFVNFTGTAGVWRASAVERVGGWRAASLVEDCELSFRHLFAGYRTTFVKEIVVPAELPATYTAYKAQQRRWTAGWVQLQRLHLRTLLFDHPTPWPRKLHLTYHMCISTQWAVWAVWLLVLPFLIASGTWFGALGAGVGAVVYLGPTSLWVVVAAVIATVETRHTYPGRRSARALVHRLTRVVPFVAINTGMLPHQFSAFSEGLFGPMHTEFERTPKTAAITSSSGGASSGGSTAVAVGATTTAVAVGGARPAVKVHRPYVAAELFFVAFQLAWAALFVRDGLWMSAAGSLALAACVLGLMYFYGDHVDRRCFVFRARPTSPR